MDRVADLRAVIGAHVKRERLRQRLTQTELARLAGTDMRTVQRLEAGRMGKLATVVVVADALGVPAWQLLRPVDRPKTRKP